MRVAGIMSGTSLDGIDIAITEITGKGWSTKVHTEAFYSRPYPARVRRALLAISNANAHTGDVSRLNVLLAEIYAEAFAAACGSAGIEPAAVQLIGCHGQTIFHEGVATRYLGYRVASTLQIGDGSFLAGRTGIPVVSDLRMADMAAGGRGAPLVPYVDYLLYRHPKRGRVSLNIGGIANVTSIPAGCGPTHVVAFDTGPGNMVVDQLVSHYSSGRQNFDRGGAQAAGGTVNARLLQQLLKNRYYRAAPPKTAGREQYGQDLIDRILAAKLPPADSLATATALTAVTIAMGIKQFCGPTQDLIVSGGGVHNLTLMRMLAGHLPGLTVGSSANYGINPDAKEAIAFAVLAYETWHRRPSNLPSATGANRPAILGKLSLPSG